MSLGSGARQVGAFLNRSPVSNLDCLPCHCRLVARIRDFYRSLTIQAGDRQGSPASKRVKKRLYGCDNRWTVLQRPFIEPVV